MYEFKQKSNSKIRNFQDPQYKTMATILDKSFCWWHIDDKTNEIDKSSEPWDDDTWFYVLDTYCEKCSLPYGIDERYPISICTECGNIQKEYDSDV